jgi:hypothetical protein
MTLNFSTANTIRFAISKLSCESVKPSARCAFLSTVPLKISTVLLLSQSIPSLVARKSVVRKRCLVLSRSTLLRDLGSLWDVVKEGRLLLQWPRLVVKAFMVLDYVVTGRFL